MSEGGALGRFSKYFTLNDAQAILPEIRARLERIVRIRASIRELAVELEETVRGNGETHGTQPRFVELVKKMEGLADEVQDRGVIVRDLDTGLIDFPSIRDGTEIFLCYRLGEESIEFWHGPEDGFPGRRPI
jgi:hypothetical protein